MTEQGPDYVRIFDTTLRDGEQSPGASMTPSEKLEVARTLSRLGVDVIEAGFPAASGDDFRAVRSIAEEVGLAPVAGRLSDLPPIVCGLARAATPDIDRAWDAVRVAARPRIHTFLATSDIHLEHKLRMSRADALERARVMVAYARTLCPDVEFSCEDATRTDPAFLYEVLTAVIKAGATTINMPDTVGYSTPDELASMIAGVRANVPGADAVVMSVHCHDDLGMATANSLAGLRAGARQVEVTLNGIGERAGNCSLEEVVMALKTRAPLFNLHTGIDTTQLVRASKVVTACTGMMVQANKAIVGANAFAHESGIHQDGMLKNNRTYEIMRPGDVGAAQTRLVLGKHSGRHALQARLGELGYPLEGKALDKVFGRFKTIADRRKHITDADLEAIVASEAVPVREAFALEGLQAACGTASMATATVRLKTADGRTIVQAAVGTGPVDALYKAIDTVVRTPMVLLEFAVRAVTEGIDALGEVSVRIRSESDTTDTQQEDARARVFHGNGADTDILVAAAKAYLGAINRLLAAEPVSTPRIAFQEEPSTPAQAAEGT
ncbi:MAG TPA: 2-isopropylmalate synthase [Polyangiaceae bacterium]